MDDVEIAPQVQVYVGDDWEAARDLMRPFLALYIGGMGSREKNFYNQLVQRYGFEDAAKEVQDLYLDGKKDEAMAAIPDELIDTVAICGPPEHVRERLAAYRDAGVGTLGVTPMAWTKEDRIAQLRHIAELNAALGDRAGRACGSCSGAFGDPGHAFPMLALGRALRARGHEVTLQTWERWRADAEREGLAFAPAPEYHVFPTQERPLKPLRGGGRGRRGETRALVRVGRARTSWWRTS